MTGRIVDGKVRVGDTIWLLTHNEFAYSVEKPFTVLGLEMFHKSLDEAMEGDNVGILIGETPGGVIKGGDALVGQYSTLTNARGRYYTTIDLDPNWNGQLSLNDGYTLNCGGWGIGVKLVAWDDYEVPRRAVIVAEYPHAFYVGQQMQMLKDGYRVGTCTIKELILD